MQELNRDECLSKDRKVQPYFQIKCKRITMTPTAPPKQKTSAASSALDVVGCRRFVDLFRGLFPFVLAPEWAAPIV